MGSELDKKRHPIQPLGDDGKGVTRFKKNEIISRLLDEGSINLNDIARWDVSNEDRTQLAQLIGYSLSGFGSLSYVDEDTYCVANLLAATAGTKSQIEVRVEALEGIISELTAKLDKIKRDLRQPIAELYGKHPYDLMEER